MSRKTLAPKEVKAVRLVKHHRVAIFASTDEVLSGEVRGDHATYSVLVRQDGESECSCPAGEHGMLCSHVLALQLEKHRREEEGEPGPN